MASSAQNAGNDQPVELPSFAAFVRKLRETISRIAEDDFDIYFGYYLDELAIALPKLLAPSATAHHQADFAFDIDEVMDMVTRAAATGHVDWEREVSSARKAREVIQGFAEVVDKMAAWGASKTDLAPSREVREEEEEAVDDRQELSNDQVYRDEQAFLDELDFQELALAIDQALDEWRQEAAGCSSDPPPTKRVSSMTWI
jgi:hypothetical protein